MRELTVVNLFDGRTEQEGLEKPLLRARCDRAFHPTRTYRRNSTTSEDANCRLHHRPALLRDMFDQQDSNLRRQPRILVNVHPGGLPNPACQLGNPQPDWVPDKQPLYNNN